MNARPSPFHSCAGVTKLELVILIGVLAVLFALLYPAVNMTNEGSLKAKAGTTVKNIGNACAAYAKDYVHCPAVPSERNEENLMLAGWELSFGDTREGGCKIDNSQLFNVLRAMPGAPNENDALNPKKVIYFKAAKATDKEHPRSGFTDGPEFPESLRGRLMDPWGTQYCIVLDGDGDGQVSLGAFYRDMADWEQKITAPAGVFSLSKDGKRGGKHYYGMFRRPNSDDAPDDVASWN